MKPKKERKAPASAPKEPEENSIAVACSTTPLNPNLVSGLVPLPSSQKHSDDSGAHPPNLPSLGTSLQPPSSPVFAPQGHVIVTSREGDSHPTGGDSPRDVSGATLRLRIHPYLLVIATGMTSSWKHSRDTLESSMG